MSIKVFLDTTPLKSGHSLRGIGMYTRFLEQELAKKNNLELLSASEKATADIIHYPFFDLFFGTLPVFRRKPTVVTIHDVIPLLFPNYYRPGKKGQLRFLRQMVALRSVDAVITDSEASKKDIIRLLKLPEEKIYVTFLAGNPELKKIPSPSVQKVLEKYHLPKNYMLYVGDINYNKNIPQLIKALKFVPDDIHLVCVGRNFKPQEIPEWQWIDTQLALSDVGNRVHFVAEVSSEANQELAALYSGAVCYVQASLAEGFGLPVLEAMQCKTPVVSSENSSLVEVGGSHVRYVQPTAESIAEGVTEVIGWSEAKREKVVREAADWATQFSWKKTATATEKVYQDVLTKKK